MCRFIETICAIDGRPQALDQHRARVRHSVRACWAGAAEHRVASAAEDVLEQALAMSRAQILGVAPENRRKLRVVYRVPPNGDAELPSVEECDLLPYQVPSIASLRVVDGGDIAYDLKYHDRTALQALYELRAGCDDVLIVRDGLLTDSSYCNIALHDGTRRVTPATPLLAGTRRARLLEEGRLETADIPIGSIGRYSQISLFNAMIELDELVLPVAAIYPAPVSSSPLLNKRGRWRHSRGAMSEIIQPRVLKGFRDSLPANEMRRKHIQTVLEHTFELYGFVPIDTPILEYAEVLLGKGGGDTDKQVYRFEDNGGRDIAMRFDLTVPFARFMAGHVAELYLPFKRYHIGKVFRGENTQRGRYREFMQCDFDIVGSDSAAADFEILLLMARCFEHLEVPGVRFHIAHRGVFNRFLAELGVADRSVAGMRAVDKRAKIGEAEVQKLLTEEVGADAAAALLEYTSPHATNEATLATITKLAGGDDGDTQRVRTMLEWSAKLGLADRVVLDPSITRGLDYYTGVVFETFFEDLPEIGSVCSGGRYNDLASLYTKQHIPGVGASIGLDRLVAALEELGKLPPARAGVDILVLCMEQQLIGRYHEIAEYLREAGMRAEVYPEAKKLGTQFSYAEKRGIPLGVICGPIEAENEVMNLKNLETRESEDQLSLAETAQKARAVLQRRSQKNYST